MLLKNQIFRFCVLAGGSKGNSIYIESEKTRILIDAGLSCKQLEARLEKIGVDPKGLHGIVITHEHRDHTNGVNVFTKKHHTPVYLNRAAYDIVKRQWDNAADAVFFQSSEDFKINDLIFSPFSIPHDAQDPIGLVIRNNGKSLGVVSDLGYVTHLVRERLKGVNSLVLESNHDIEMLFSGPYPWALKQRVKGKSGHLSNEESRQLLEDILHSPGLKSVILTHLSETNNHPDLVHSSVGKFLKERGVDFDIASQHYVSRVMDVFF
ncbi:MAG: MBL fold metallo-hydrolase [Nitrospinae bacterium]|nr:MBL fold metallo-hydrolase [Nitrospinota bacterium]